MKRSATTLLAGMVLVAGAVFGEVPPQLGVVVMLKVLTYDASFTSRGTGDFVVCVPTSELVPGLAARLAELEPVGATLISGRKVRLRQVPADQVAGLAGLHASAVLFLPGLEPQLVDQWAAAATQLKLYTVSLEPSDAQQKVLLSVEAVEGKPRPVVNFRVATAVGAQFPPSVLRLARVVQ